MSSPNKPSPPGASPSVPDVNREYDSTKPYNVYSNARPLYTQKQMDAANPGAAPEPVKAQTGLPLGHLQYGVDPQKWAEDTNRVNYERWQGRVRTHQQMGVEQQMYRLTPGGYRFVAYPQQSGTVRLAPDELKVVSEYGTTDYTAQLRPDAIGIYSPETRQAMWKSTLRGTLQQFTQKYPGIDGPNADKLYPRHIVDDYNATWAALENPNSLAEATDLAATKQMYDAERQFGHFTNGAMPTYTRQLPSEYIGANHMPALVKLDDGTTYRYMSPVYRLRNAWADDIVNRMSRISTANETQAANSAINAAWNFAEGSPFGLSARMLDLMAWTMNRKADGLKMLTGSTMQELENEYIEAVTKVRGPQYAQRAAADFRAIAAIGQGLGTVVSAGMLTPTGGTSLAGRVANGVGTASNATGLTSAAKGVANAVQKGVQAVRQTQAAQAVANVVQRTGQVISKIPGATQTGNAIVGTAKAGAGVVQRLPGQWLNFGIDSAGNSFVDALQAYAEDPNLSPMQRTMLATLSAGISIGTGIFGGRGMDEVLFDPLRRGLASSKAAQTAYRWAQKSPLWLRNQFTNPSWATKALGSTIKADVSNMGENAIELTGRALVADVQDGTLGQEDSSLAMVGERIAKDPMKALGSNVRQSTDTVELGVKVVAGLKSPEARKALRGLEAQEDLKGTREALVDAAAKDRAAELGGTAEEHAERLRQGLARGDKDTIDYLDSLIGDANSEEVHEETIDKLMKMVPAGVDPGAWLQSTDGKMAYRAIAVPELMRLAKMGQPVNYDYLFDNTLQVSTADDRRKMLTDIVLARHGVTSDGLWDTLSTLKTDSERGKLEALVRMAHRDPVTRRACLAYMKGEAVNYGRQVASGAEGELGQGMKDSEIVSLMQTFTDEERDQVVFGFLGQLDSADQLLDMTEGKDLSGAGSFASTALGFYLNNAGVEGRKLLGEEFTRLMINGSPVEIFNRFRRLHARFSDPSKPAAVEANSRMGQLIGDILSGTDVKLIEQKIDSMDQSALDKFAAMVCSPEGQAFLASFPEESGKQDEAAKAVEDGGTTNLKAFAGIVRKAVEKRYSQAMKDDPIRTLPLVVGMKMASNGWGETARALSDPAIFYSLVTLILTGGVAMLFAGGGDSDDDEDRDHDAQAMEKADRQRMLWLRQNDLW